ncbi:MAG: hypothetical protein CMC82_03670 [Flavobacteriaceae bacterium]|nr:hypothetical protein [Flavobacteriaceae bacterium]|tara:strand:- start:13062 stop:13307 length:246 start_codon:yes stop_codon:yes gene_type:complete
MKFSNNIPLRITQYLNDIEDYGDDSVYTPEYTSLCESTLSGIKPLILESLNPMLVLENYKKDLTKKQKAIIDDFILYIENI